MSLPFALGLMAGAAVVVFGRETSFGRKLLVQLHLRSALLLRWFHRRS